MLLASRPAFFGEQGLTVKLRRLAAGTDEAVSHASREAGGDGSRRGDIYGHRNFRAVVDGGVLGAEVLALVADALLASEPAHEFDGLAQAGEAYFEWRPLYPGGRHFIQGFAGADTEHDASRI